MSRQVKEMKILPGIPVSKLNGLFDRIKGLNKDITDFQRCVETTLSGLERLLSEVSLIEKLSVRAIPGSLYQQLAPLILAASYGKVANYLERMTSATQLQGAKGRKLLEVFSGLHRTINLASVQPLFLSDTSSIAEGRDEYANLPESDLKNLRHELYGRIVRYLATLDLEDVEPTDALTEDIARIINATSERRAAITSVHKIKRVSFNVHKDQPPPIPEVQPYVMNVAWKLAVLIQQIRDKEEKLQRFHLATNQVLVLSSPVHPTPAKLLIIMVKILSDAAWEVFHTNHILIAYHQKRVAQLLYRKQSTRLTTAAIHQIIKLYVNSQDYLVNYIDEIGNELRHANSAVIRFLKRNCDCFNLFHFTMLANCES